MAPSDDLGTTYRLSPPSDEESRVTARGVATAVAPDGGLTDVQRVLLEALFLAMTGTEVDLRVYEPVGIDELAEHLSDRALPFRQRGVQVMLLAALVLRPIPSDVVDRVARYADALGVDDEMIGIARRFASGSLGLAAFDFQRNGYTATWRAQDAEALHTSDELSDAWQASVADPALAHRWADLEAHPAGTLGRAVWEMYRARGFAFPGRPGSAPPLLAQHDWVHVLVDYGTTVESELEVFGFIARSNDDMRAFSLLAMVISLFETGYLSKGAGLFESSPGHLSAGEEMAVRLADAMRRGALSSDRVMGSDSVDYLRFDWFSIAELPLEEARARFSIPPKSDTALAAGSVSCWEPGGISPFQVRAGREAAERGGYEYESFGASAD